MSTVLVKVRKEIQFSDFFFLDFGLADTGVWFYNGIQFKITKLYVQTNYSAT